LKAHDVVRRELGLPTIHGYNPLNDYGIVNVINKMQVEEDIDLSHLEVEQIVKAVDSHKNIAEEYGISGEQVYMVKALFR
jgi:DNA-binding Lrp family transcriptional regulator